MQDVKNRGWSVTMAGLGINLTLGILYTWSIFKQSIKDSMLVLSAFISMATKAPQAEPEENLASFIGRFTLLSRSAKLTVWQLHAQPLSPQNCKFGTPEKVLTTFRAK